MIVRERLIGLAVAAAAVLLTAWLSQVPLAVTAVSDGVLRLAWRARPERIEDCRAQSPEALAALPPHMRQAVICEGENASYRLEIRRDGILVAEQRVRAGGLRRDRPLYVFREIAVPAGDAGVSVRFTRVEASSQAGENLTEAVPASLAFEERLHFAPGQVRVISYDPARRVLFEVAPY